MEGPPKPGLYKLQVFARKKPKKRGLLKIPLVATILLDYKLGGQMLRELEFRGTSAAAAKRAGSSSRATRAARRATMSNSHSTLNSIPSVEEKEDDENYPNKSNLTLNTEGGGGGGANVEENGGSSNSKKPQIHGETMETEFMTNSSRSSSSIKIASSTTTRPHLGKVPSKYLPASAEESETAAAAVTTAATAAGAAAAAAAIKTGLGSILRVKSATRKKHGGKEGK